MANAIALVSGGLDSVVMLHKLVKQMNLDPLVLLFDYRQRQTRELVCAKWHAMELGLKWQTIHTDMPKEVVLPGVDDDFPTYVPSRNVVLFSLAGAVAESLRIERVYDGFHYVPGHPGWDAAPEFVEAMNAVFKLNDHFRVTFYSPIWELLKTEIVQLGMELRVDFEHTWSCYTNQHVACGVCPICKVRLRTFAKLGLQDPIEYSNRDAQRVLE